MGHVSAADITATRPAVIPSSATGAPTVVIFGAGEARAVPLDRPLTVGRGEEVELRLDDGSASRHHLRIEPKDGGFELVDLGSRNGTFVDGRPVLRATVSTGSLVRVGDTLLSLRALTEPFSPAGSEGPLLGGARLQPIRRMISLVGPTTLPVLILGETGTGKEVVARLFHQASGRQGPFIAVNCAALPEPLVESELFGHVKGAFTDAGAGRKGLFGAAADGTLFLDEVGDLPLGAQAKLLRVLEDGVVRPVGGESGRRLDVRILSATNRDLSANAFRPDLLARLSAVEVRTPPLREHPEDLPVLAAYLGRRAGVAGLTLAPDALEAMALYEWPQNVRELDNVVRSAMLGAETAELDFPRLPGRIQDRLRRARGQLEPRQPAPPDLRARLEEALRVHRGNVRRASLSLGIARSHAYRLMDRWKLEADRFRRGTPIAESDGD